MAARRVLFAIVLAGLTLLSLAAGRDFYKVRLRPVVCCR
jgi:hypothetical protein